MVRSFLAFTFFLLAFSASNIYGQVFVSESSFVRFFSAAPLENIEAFNKDAKIAVDFEKMTFSVRIPIKSFVFEKELMQEHFNENYMESDKFPNATFKGTLTGEINPKKDGIYQLQAKGEAEIHGVKKEYAIPLKATVKGGVIETEALFMVKLADHKIDIPTVVFKKIAEEVEVTVKSKLAKKQ
jgi:hypothetical protein